MRRPRPPRRVATSRGFRLRAAARAGHARRRLSTADPTAPVWRSLRGRSFIPISAYPEHGFFVEVDHLSWHGARQEGRLRPRRDLKVRATHRLSTSNESPTSLSTITSRKRSRTSWRSGTVVRARRVAMLSAGRWSPVVVASVLASPAAAATTEPASLPPDVGVVEVVIDGDTVDIEIGGREERVRLIGIDTPELHTDAGPAECMAVEARRVHVVGNCRSGPRCDSNVTSWAVTTTAGCWPTCFGVPTTCSSTRLIIAGGYARPLTIAPNDAYADASSRRRTPPRLPTSACGRRAPGSVAVRGRLDRSRRLAQRAPRLLAGGQIGDPVVRRSGVLPRRQRRRLPSDCARDWRPAPR